MNIKRIVLDDVKYELNVDAALKKGVLKHLSPITFDDVKIGEVFKYSDTEGSGIFVKDTIVSASRIAGFEGFEILVGNVSSGCTFYTNPLVFVLRDGKWTDQKE